jgi:hypothetical protein
MLVRGGERRDSAYYSVIDDDSPEVRANLEQRLMARQPRALKRGICSVTELPPRIAVRRRPERVYDCEAIRCHPRQDLDRRASQGAS